MDLNRLIEEHYKFIGCQLDEHNQLAFKSYNCNHCHTTLSEGSLIEHYKKCGIMYEKFRVEGHETRQVDNRKFMTKKYEI
jgi:hypothetical protein